MKSFSGVTLLHEQVTLQIAHINSGIRSGDAKRILQHTAEVSCIGKILGNRIDDDCIEMSGRNIFKLIGGPGEQFDFRSI